MVHYATDVLGGLLVGVIAAVLGYLLMKLVMKSKGLEKVDAAKLFKKVPGKVALPASVWRFLVFSCMRLFPPSAKEAQTPSVAPM